MERGLVKTEETEEREETVLGLELTGLTEVDVSGDCVDGVADLNTSCIFALVAGPKTP